MRGGRIFRRQRAADAVCAAGRRPARLPRRRDGGCRRGAAVGRVVGAGRQCARRADRRQGRFDVRAVALSVPQYAAAGACAPPGRRAARSRRPRAQYFPDLLPRPAAWHFSGSGVGKSVLLSMLARNVAADVTVIGLIGERGREVQEFLQDDLGDAGLARSVVVVSTSDEPALMRRGRARDARDRGIFPRRRQRRSGADGFGDPLCHGAARDRPLRRRAADRQGLHAHGLYRAAAPARARRPRHRAGHHHRHLHRPGRRRRPYEPIADAVRGILDGHIVMERAIAERGRYPAINILKSVRGPCRRGRSGVSAGP